MYYHINSEICNILYEGYFIIVEIEISDCYENAIVMLKDLLALVLYRFTCEFLH